MLNFENGIKDLVKRIDNVTIQLAGLFCNLENELTELYLLIKNNNDKNNNHFVKKSEFIEGMKQLLKESLISNDHYSNDEYLITMDNSVMSLESLTSAVLGTRSHINCFIIDENQQIKMEGISQSLYNDFKSMDINENSTLISLCRSINRLTKHRLKIEKYDVDINTELDSIKKDQNKLLEHRLRETESKLRKKEVQCYAYQKQIEFLKKEMEELYRIQKLSTKKENICVKCNLMQHENTDSEFLDLRTENSNNSILDVKKTSLEEIPTYNNEPLNNYIEMLNVQDISEEGDKKVESRDNTSIQESIIGENLEILKLNDQLQLLNIDIQLLREENDNLKTIIKNKNENLTKQITNDDPIDECEILYNIMHDKEYSKTRNMPRTPKLKVVKQQDLVIKELIGRDNVQLQRPCLVMWEPIIENCTDVSNIVPISISSYGQFRKSKKEAGNRPKHIIEGIQTNKRIVINRNSFYCDLEAIIKRNTK